MSVLEWKLGRSGQQIGINTVNYTSQNITNGDITNQHRWKNLIKTYFNKETWPKVAGAISQWEDTLKEYYYGKNSKKTHQCVLYIVSPPGIGFA
jgi:hypothetical protein